MWYETVQKCVCNLLCYVFLMDKGLGLNHVQLYCCNKAALHLRDKSKVERGSLT